MVIVVVVVVVVVYISVRKPFVISIIEPRKNNKTYYSVRRQPYGFIKHACLEARKELENGRKERKRREKEKKRKEKRAKNEAAIGKHI